MMSNIEILSVDLLDQNRSQVKQLKRLARSLGLEFGWHYLLDLTWILKQLEQVGFPEKSASLYVMDAGAGTGILQWYLAEQGVQVLSVDRGERYDLPLKFRTRYHVQGLRSQDLGSASQVVRSHLREREKEHESEAGSFTASLRKKLGLLSRDALGLARLRRAPGSVMLYHQNLNNLVDVQDRAVDVVASVSALEHNPPEELPGVAAELMRVLRPGGILLATLGAASRQDWFHEPSRGWCYTEATLRRLFDLPERIREDAEVPSSYARYDELMERLRNCAELRDNLARFYAKSGDTGMPWGKWDPQYQPVGVCKIKEG
jgi:SAM-dependent methyltransferase